MSEQNKTTKLLSLACARKYVCVVFGLIIALAVLLILHIDEHNTLFQIWQTQNTVRVTFVSQDRTFRRKGHKQLKCYNFGQPWLKDIQKEASPPKSNSIFFLDTSCRSHAVKRIAIVKRHACSIESAARAHPKRSIYLLYASPGVVRNDQSESDLMLKVLIHYKNIKLFHLNVTKFLKETPLEKWYTNGKLRFSKYEADHTNSLMRLLTLWRYGGIFIDMDVMVLNSLDDLDRNFLVSEDSKTISDAIFGFGKDGKGHAFLEACLHDFMTNYTIRSKNRKGLDTLSRMAKDVCHTPNTEEMNKSTCNSGFEVYPSLNFVPVEQEHWKQKLFHDDDDNAIAKSLERSYTVLVHDKLSAMTRIPLNSTAPYLTLARKYCPKVMRYCKGYF